MPLDTGASGGGGIRTRGPGLPDSGFQDQRIRPLCHPSGADRRCYPAHAMAIVADRLPRRQQPGEVAEWLKALAC